MKLVQTEPRIPALDKTVTVELTLGELAVIYVLAGMTSLDDARLELAEEAYFKSAEITTKVGEILVDQELCDDASDILAEFGIKTVN